MSTIYNNKTRSLARSITQRTSHFQENVDETEAGMVQTTKRDTYKLEVTQEVNEDVTSGGRYANESAPYQPFTLQFCTDELLTFYVLT